MQLTAAKRLKACLRLQQTIVAPGVYDGLSTLLAQQAGFSVLYASGGAISRSAGYLDLGILTMTEVIAAVENIVNATSLPIIADADTGFGGDLNVQRTVRAFEQIGVAGIHLEDQIFPKKCGHLDDKSLISIQDMCRKIRIARDCLHDPDFLLIARTDAIAVEGFTSAIDRANAYSAAGADMLFVEAPETIEQIETIAKEVSGLKLINMFHGGKTPVISVQRLTELGFNIIIIPSDAQRAAIKAMQTTLAAIYQYGNSESVADQLVTFQEREKLFELRKQ